MAPSEESVDFRKCKEERISIKRQPRKKNTGEADLSITEGHGRTW